MKDFCFSISEIMERYFDHQATDQERSLVENHLSDYSFCQEKLKELESLRMLIKAPVDEALEQETFPWIWEKIEKELHQESKPSWRESFRSWLNLSPFFKKRVWIPAMAMAIVLIFFTIQTIFKQTPSYSDLTVVEYVESETHNVLVYDLEKSNVTVIWVFEDQEEETFSS